MTDCIVRARIDAQVKEEANALFNSMGMTLSEALRLFLYQSIAERRLPFSVNVPNAETIAAIEEAGDPANLTVTSIEQLMSDWKKWENECPK